MASKVVLAAPKSVSPFIRFCRWSALFTGIAYGHFRYNRLEKKEKTIQARENAVRERIAIHNEKVQGERLKVEMNNLAKDAGVVPK